MKIIMVLMCILLLLNVVHAQAETSTEIDNNQYKDKNYVNSLDAEYLAAAIGNNQVEVSLLEDAKLLEVLNSNPEIITKISSPSDFLRALEKGLDSSVDLFTHGIILDEFNLRLEAVAGSGVQPRFLTTLNTKPNVIEYWLNQYGLGYIQDDTRANIKKFAYVDGVPMVTTIGQSGSTEELKGTTFAIHDFAGANVLPDGSLGFIKQNGEDTEVYKFTGSDSIEVINGVVKMNGGSLDYHSSTSFPSIPIKVESTKANKGRLNFLAGKFDLIYTGDFTVDGPVVASLPKKSFQRLISKKELGYLNNALEIEGAIKNSFKQDFPSFILQTKKDQPFMLRTVNIDSEGKVSGGQGNVITINNKVDQDIFYSEVRGEECNFEPCIINSVGSNLDSRYRTKIGFYGFNNLDKVDFKAASYYDKVEVEGLQSGTIEVASLVAGSPTVKIGPGGRVSSSGKFANFAAGRIDVLFQKGAVVRGSQKSYVIPKFTGSTLAGYQKFEREQVEKLGFSDRAELLKEHSNLFTSNGKYLKADAKLVISQPDTQGEIDGTTTFRKHWSSNKNFGGRMQNYFGRTFQGADGKYRKVSRNSFVTCGDGNDCEQKFAKNFGKIIPPRGKTVSGLGSSWNPSTTIIVAGDIVGSAKSVEAQCKFEGGCIILNSRDMPVTTKSKNVVVTGHHFINGGSIWRSAPKKLSPDSPISQIDGYESHYNPIDSVVMTDLPVGENVEHVFFKSCNSVLNRKDYVTLVDLSSKYANLQTIQGYDGKNVGSKIPLATTIEDMVDNKAVSSRGSSTGSAVRKRAWYLKGGDQWYYTNDGSACVNTDTNKEFSCQTITAPASVAGVS